MRCDPLCDKRDQLVAQISARGNPLVPHLRALRLCIPSLHSYASGESVSSRRPLLNDRKHLSNGYPSERDRVILPRDEDCSNGPPHGVSRKGRR